MQEGVTEFEYEGKKQEYMHMYFQSGLEDGCFQQ